MENESENKKKRKKHFLPLHVYMMYLFVCTLLFTGVSLSKYVSMGSGDDAARVAAGNVEVTYNDSTSIYFDLPADGGMLTQDFDFYVSNTGSEVAIRYDIEVTLDDSLPKGATITLDDEAFDGGNDHTYLFEDVGIFRADEYEKHSHTLTIEADYAEVPAGTAFSSFVYIDIIAEQIN